MQVLVNKRLFCPELKYMIQLYNLSATRGILKTSSALHYINIDNHDHYCSSKVESQLILKSLSDNSRDREKISYPVILISMNDNNYLQLIHY